MQVVPYELFAGALCLDGPTLQNLDLLENQEDGCTRVTLMSVLDNCASAGTPLSPHYLQPHFTIFKPAS